MKKRSRTFIQHLSHDIEDEDAAKQYLEDSLPLIGEVVMYFNGLEKQLDSLICEKFSDRTDSIGLIVLYGMSYSSKVDLFKRFADDFNSCGDFPMPEHKRLIDELREVGRLRNLVVHADWSSTDEDGSYCQIWCSGLESSGDLIGSCYLDSIFEFHSSDDFRQIIEPPLAAPVLLGTQAKLEHHMQHPISAQAAL